MKTITKNELYDNLVFFIRYKSKAYKEGIACKTDAEKFAMELTKYLAKQNFYIKREDAPLLKKIFEKFFKNPLTNRQKCGIIDM